MNKEIISDKEGISLMILFISGGTLFLPTAKEAGHNLWLAILVALVIAIPIMIIYGRLLSLFPGKDLFDISELILGKVFGKIFILMFTLFAFNLGALVIRNAGQFLMLTSLPETPLMVPMVFIALVGLWGARAGIEIMGRWASFFVLLNGPLPSILVFLLIPYMDLLNIQPILHTNLASFGAGTLSALCFPFTETIVLAMAVLSLKSKKSSYRIFIIGTIIGGIFIAGVSLAEVLILGEELYLTDYFPNHATAKIVSIGEFLHRLEILTILATFTANFLKFTLCLLATSKGISKLFSLKDYRFITFPTCVLIVLFGYIYFDNYIDFSYWSTYFRKYYFPLFTIIMPSILWVVVEIRKKKLIAKYRQTT